MRTGTTRRRRDSSTRCSAAASAAGAARARPRMRRRPALEAPGVERLRGHRPGPGGQQHREAKQGEAAAPSVPPARHARAVRPPGVRLRLQLLHEFRLLRDRPSTWRSSATWPARLKPGGRLVLDYLNVPHADAHLTPRGDDEIDGVAYRIRRWTDARLLLQADRHRRRDRTRADRVRRAGRQVHAQDFERMFAPSRPEHRRDLRRLPLERLRRATSPRMILVARKRGAAGSRATCATGVLRTRLSVSGETPR